VDVCHNVHPFSTRGGDLLRRSRFDRVLLATAYRQFRHIFVHYETNRRALLAAFSVDPGRVTSIEHGHEALFERLRSTTVTASALRRQLNLAAGDPVVLLFGTLTRYKGCDLLLQAFHDVIARVPNAHLVCAGYPAADFDLDAHRRMARDLGIADRVRFVPQYIEGFAVGGWMDVAAVAVFPYRAGFQSGAVALAQTFGLPVIVSAVGAMPAMVRNGETGLVVPPGNPSLLADALITVLQDARLRGRLGEAGRAHRLEAGDWNRIARTLLSRLDPGALSASPAAAAGDRLEAFR
jgi:glycosyltransferase involved in cell wall biosynthesis